MQAGAGDAMSKSKLGMEEDKQQLSPVSVLDFPFDDDDADERSDAGTCSPSFHHRCPTTPPPDLLLHSKSLSICCMRFRLYYIFFIPGRLLHDRDAYFRLLCASQINTSSTDHATSIYGAHRINTCSVSVPTRYGQHQLAVLDQPVFLAGRTWSYSTLHSDAEPVPIENLLCNGAALFLKGKRILVAPRFRFPCFLVSLPRELGILTLVCRL